MPDSELIDANKITEKDLDYIAEKLEHRMYESIGKSVVSRFFWVVGLIAVSVTAYLKGKGLL